MSSIADAIQDKCSQFSQSKLLRCVKGTVLDVALDVRKGTPTYGQHVACLLCVRGEANQSYYKG